MPCHRLGVEPGKKARTVGLLPHLHMALKVVMAVRHSFNIYLGGVVDVR